MSGYGLGSWGTSTWGIGNPPPLPTLSIQQAYAIGTNTVRVVLTAEPLHFSPTGLGDALNPKTWQVYLAQTGRQLFPVLVKLVDATTYDIQTLQSFDSSQYVTVVKSLTLKDAGGNTVPETSADFAGAQNDQTVNTTVILGSRGYNVVDIRNTQVPNAIEYGGTLSITSGGDYAGETGPAFVKKMIYRRLLATPSNLSATGVGDYYHLPNYGAGLLAQVKMPLTPPTLVTMKKLVESQVLKEPEVDSVKASLSFDASKGILTIALVAKLRLSGQTVNMVLPIAVA